MDSDRSERASGFRFPFLAAVAGTIVIFTVFGLAARSRVTGFQCRNLPFAEVLAPDGKHKAVSFVRDCGRRAPRSTQLALIGPDEVLGNRYGNIFVAELEPYNDIDVRWSAPNVLEIRLGKIRRAYRADPGLGEIRVLYGRTSE